jgi:hypothetical protein
MRYILHSIGKGTLVLALVFGARFTASAAEAGRSFATPEEAVAALATAAETHDTNAFRILLGPAAAEVQNPDQVQAASESAAFAAACRERQRIVRRSDTECVLEVGDYAWPFPIPLVRREGQWFFDTEAGKDELLNRRIGRNELSSLQVVRAYVDAQREYAWKDRDGDEVLEYAQQVMSSPDRKDGLYWPADLDGEISPLGPLVAQAQAQGYAQGTRGQGTAPAPFHGYFYRILTSQGDAAPGGAYDYIINGNMIGGFALVAWPAEYGTSGIMTFIVNQQGRVYQKDLGPETDDFVRRMKAYQPDKTWGISPD